MPLLLVAIYKYSMLFEVSYKVGSIVHLMWIHVLLLLARSTFLYYFMLTDK